MNWDAIGAISEGLGSLAVLASLLYVAVQVRHMRRQARISSLQHIHDALNGVNDLIVSSESVASLIRRGRDSYASLSADEQMRFDHLHANLINIGETWHLQVMQTFEPGLDRDEQLRMLRENIRGYCRFPGVVAFWRAYESYYVPAIRRLVDECLSEVISPPASNTSANQQAPQARPSASHALHEQ